MKLLSVVIPVFNELHTIAHILAAVSQALPEVEKEVIVVDDGSLDGTSEWIRLNIPEGHCSASRFHVDPAGHLQLERDPTAPGTTVRTLFHERSMGKGSCLRTALRAITGDIIVIQDADLEYDPQDWAVMHALIAQREAQVVYGSRFLGEQEGRAVFVSRAQVAANRVISALFALLYGRRLSDVEVCYKMFTREVSDSLNLTCSDFGCEIQISAQIVRNARWSIREVPVSYRGRSTQEGKKISWRDGIKALGYLLRFRIAANLPKAKEPTPQRYVTLRDVSVGQDARAFVRHHSQAPCHPNDPARPSA